MKKNIPGGPGGTKGYRMGECGGGGAGWDYLWLEGNYELFYQVEIRERSLLNVAFYCNQELEGKSETNLGGWNSGVRDVE